MNDSESELGTAFYVKCATFGIVYGITSALLRRLISASAWELAALTGVVTLLLFFWLPPRIHKRMTVPVAIGLALLGGLASGGAVFLVDRFL